jgi:outer membrane protein OmpA-like peptidoglycan-associated protein
MEQVVVRNKLGLVILGVAFAGLTGCSYVPDAVNPVSWYRDVTGASKNDNLGNGENQQNLDEGGNEPYPNLGSVPAAPDTQLSGVDRDKLVNSLVADRNNAQYSADSLHAGEVASTAPPPAPPASATAKGAPSAVTASAAPASTPPAPSANSALAPPVAKPPAATASNTGAPPSAPSPTSGTAANAPRKLPPRGSEAPPAESSLQSPSIPNVPRGEAATPAPPPPHIAPPNQVASAAPPAAATRAPLLHPPTQQTSAPATAPATASPSHSSISYRVGDVTFAPGSAYLSGALRGTIADVVKLHNEQGGKIRIVGFGEATGKDAAVAGLTLALDRAQAVAVALTDGGVQAKDINVEAAPVPARGGADAPRAEIYLEQ